MNLRTMTLIANSNNLLVKKAFKHGIKHCEETKDNIYSKWLLVLKEYNLTLKKNEMKFKLKKIKTGNNFDIHTDGSRLESKTGMGINIYDCSNMNTPVRSLSLHINDQYSNNVAEICSIITAAKVIPRDSKIKIHTDSNVAIEVLKERYKGNFLPLKKAFFKTIKDRKLEYEFKKVEAHKDKENIKVDLLAKNATLKPKIFDIRKLLFNQYILTKNDIIIFDYKRLTTSQHLRLMLDKIESHPNHIPNLDWNSINVSYLKSHLSPKSKYYIWRNSSNAHINFGEGKSFCHDCNTESDLNHYIHECPALDSARYFCLSKISDILDQRECKLTHIQFRPEKHHHVLFFHHSGTTFFEDGYVQQYPDIAEKWPEIQGAISNFVGRSYRYYYIDSM
ncbi:predicted protein [Naegleria gruberi]|nr:uncharacterized protein NAEGRDRAFT_82331 [Naegleria gruberi]EFC35914.1 predicted protein [Naegleria gruberi]|eukprot:XP_002668658.1 predicted protein [Naegleria gruberi strain NEG-M]